MRGISPCGGCKRPSEEGEGEGSTHCLHWVTWSVWKMRVGVRARTISCAVLRLTTNCKEVGRSTGRSSGLELLKILTTWAASPARSHP
jgi:hypothetical protein